MTRTFISKYSRKVCKETHTQARIQDSLTGGPNPNLFDPPHVFFGTSDLGGGISLWPPVYGPCTYPKNIRTS